MKSEQEIREKIQELKKINNEWQDLTESEQEQIADILRG